MTSFLFAIALALGANPKSVLRQVPSAKARAVATAQQQAKQYMIWSARLSGASVSWDGKCYVLRGFEIEPGGKDITLVIPAGRKTLNRKLAMLREAKNQFFYIFINGYKRKPDGDPTQMASWLDVDIEDHSLSRPAAGGPK